MIMWWLMRNAAMCRHALWVYGTWGPTEQGHMKMKEHADLVRAFYGF